MRVSTGPSRQGAPGRGQGAHRPPPRASVPPAPLTAHIACLKRESSPCCRSPTRQFLAWNLKTRCGLHRQVHSLSMSLGSPLFSCRRALSATYPANGCLPSARGHSWCPLSAHCALSTDGKFGITPTFGDLETSLRGAARGALREDELPLNDHNAFSFAVGYSGRLRPGQEVRHAVEVLPSQAAAPRNCATYHRDAVRSLHRSDGLLHEQIVLARNLMTGRENEPFGRGTELKVLRARNTEQNGTLIVTFAGDELRNLNCDQG